MYLIDAYNLLHVLKPNRRAAVDDLARLQMLAMLSEFARRKSTSVICFFDGTSGQAAPGEFHRPGVRAIFCGPDNQSADAAICRYVEDAREPHKLKVVSNDNEVRSVCKREGAKLLKSDDFAHMLTPPKPQVSAREAESTKEPMKREHFSGIEREMLEEIGDIDEFEREVLDE
ncbi:MAG: NYN domain-containing protein [Planctomycetes bacterium]|nr:NYN domain-containing protein [Planctomycetota bacterium]